MNLESHLKSRRSKGRKLLVPYVTGGFADAWTDVVRACAESGADAVEVGIAFSDPVMDGPIIQESSQRALSRGATPANVISELGGLDIGVPLVVMTYYNPVHHAGHERFAAWLSDAGVDGAIIPDLPVDELGNWGIAADAARVETVLLAAPTTPPERLLLIAKRTRGFLYGVSLLGVTGERRSLAGAASQMGQRCRQAATDVAVAGGGEDGGVPVLLGVGISDSSQAVEGCAHADGVVVGSALVRRLLEGCGPSGAGDFVAEIRKSLDASY